MSKLICLLGLSASLLMMCSCGSGMDCPLSGCSDEPELLIPANQEFKKNVLDDEELITFALAADSLLEGEWEFTQVLDTFGYELLRNLYLSSPTITFSPGDSLNPATYELHDGCNYNGISRYELDAFDGTFTFPKEELHVSSLVGCTPKIEPIPEDYYSLWELDGYTYNFTLSESNDTLTLTNPLPDTSRVSSLTFIRHKE